MDTMQCQESKIKTISTLPLLYSVTFCILGLLNVVGNKIKHVVRPREMHAGPGLYNPCCEAFTHSSY